MLEKGQTYSGLGDTQKAVAAFEQLRATYKQSAQARKGMLNLAITYMQAKQPKQAEEAYKEVISRWPSSEEAALANDDLRRFMPPTAACRSMPRFCALCPTLRRLTPMKWKNSRLRAAETVFAGNVTDIELLKNT